MCYRSPNDSTNFYQVTICPWNAIDMLHNPNVKPDDTSVLEPYYKGNRKDLSWSKLEEYGYQFFLDGQVYLPKEPVELKDFLTPLQDEVWMYSEEDNISILQEAEETEHYLSFRTTEEGRELLDCIFGSYHRIFMD